MNLSSHTRKSNKKYLTFWFFQQVYMVQSRPCAILCLFFLVTFTPPPLSKNHSFHTEQHLLHKDTATVTLMATGKSTTSLPPHTHTHAHVHTSHFLLSSPSPQFRQLPPPSLLFSPPLVLSRSTLSEQDRVGVLLDYQLLSADYTPHTPSLRGNPWWRGEEVQRHTDRNGGQPRSTGCPVEGGGIV